MRAIIWFLVCMLILLHHDYWNWDDKSLLFGMPIGLTYHIFLSIAASAVWAIACFTIWPDALKEEPNAETHAGDVPNDAKGDQ